MTTDDAGALGAPDAFGPFRVMHQIGVGVLGPVYRVYNPTRDSLFAVKAFHVDLTPEQAQKLAALLERLAEAGPFHAGVVAATAAGVEDGVPFLAQEYVAAESLDVAMRHYAPIALGTALPLIRRLAEAVDAAHARGIVHGGLHLRDVFFTPGGARMTGFGVVPAIEKVGFSGPLRRPYAAPEVVAGQAWGPEADRYSLAAVAYELLTGKRAAGTAEQIAARLGAVDKVEDLGSMQAAFTTALAGKPERRYPDAFRFASDLHAAAGVDIDDPPAPPPPVVAPEASRPSVRVDRRDAAAASAAGGRQDELPLTAAAEPAIETADGSAATEARSDARLPGETGSGGRPRPDGFDEPDDVEDGFDPEDVADRPDRRRAQDVFDRNAPAGAPSDGGEYAQRRSWMSGSGPAIVVVLCIGAAAAYFVGFRLAGGYAPGSGRAGDGEIASPRTGVEAAGDAGPADASRDPAPIGAEPDGPPAESAASAPPVTSRPVISPPIMRQPADSLLPPIDPLPPLADPSSPPIDPPLPLADPSPSPIDPPLPPVESSLPPIDPSPPPVEPAAASVREDRPPAPAAAPEPPPGASWLLVRTTPPGAAVAVNGVDRGRTPLSIRDLPFGAYRVEVSRSGFQPQAREMTLSPADPVAAIEIDLLPAPAPPAAAAAGSIVVESRPSGATVILDGRVVGATPAVVADVAAGTHQVRIERDGYRPWVADVEVEGSDQVRVAASLDHLPGR